MLRKGIVALMITIMSVGVSTADDSKPKSLMGFLKGPSIGRPHQAKSDSAAKASAGVTHAVVSDAERQVPEIRQTSARPEPDVLLPVGTAPQPTPVQYHAPAAPVSSQHFFPATQAGYPAQFASRQASGVPVHSVGFRNGQHHLPSIHNNVPMGGGSSAALYPAPRGGIPPQVGGTAIVNHAFHPHEMMYPHKYKAMYGPYYYKVRGKWIVTPFGTWSNENWKLQGTTVEVKYKSHISPFAKFRPPVR